jgi:hypothetical protein
MGRDYRYPKWKHTERNASCTVLHDKRNGDFWRITENSVRHQIYTKLHNRKQRVIRTKNRIRKQIIAWKSRENRSLGRQLKRWIKTANRPHGIVSYGMMMMMMMIKMTINYNFAVISHNSTVWYELQIQTIETLYEPGMFWLTQKVKVNVKLSLCLT